MVLALAHVVAAGPASAEPVWPSEVSAKYRIAFGGIDIGSFRFQSKSGAGTYSLNGKADVRAPLGAFEWSGSTNSAGAVADSGPKPSAYNFDFNSSAIIGKDKTGLVRMAFKDGAVANLAVQPSKPPPPDMVPLKDEHKRNVLDPLSAVMALAVGGTQRPCDRKLSIFDGKQRFDLTLSYRGQQRIAEARPSGQPGIGFVCRVRYQPIAGFRKNEETKTFDDNANIEIVFRPVPTANLVVPYQVSIPTGAGTAVLKAERIDITTPNRSLIALSH